MRKILVLMALGASIFTLLGTPPAAQADSCLGGAIGFSGMTTRRCDFKRADGFAASYCTQFFPDFGISSNFVMLFPGGTVLSCTCEASGSFLVPKFHATKDFLCGAIDDGSEFSDSASGKVVGKKIKKGQYLDGNTPAHAWVFECAPDPVMCP